MKAETVEYLAKSLACFEAAKKIQAVRLPEVAAKEAYLAAYHAAQALIFERAGKVVKTHGGMRTMLAGLAKQDPKMDRALSSQLARTYKFKEVADYGIGSQGVVTLQEAQEVINIAESFVESVNRLLHQTS